MTPLPRFTVCHCANILTIVVYYGEKRQFIMLMTIIIIMIIDNVDGQRERANNRQTSNLNGYIPTRLWTVKQSRELEEGEVCVCVRARKRVGEIQFVPKPKTSSTKPKSLRFARQTRVTFSSEFPYDSDADDDSTPSRSSNCFLPSPSPSPCLKNQFLFSSSLKAPPTTLPPCKLNSPTSQYNSVRQSNYAWNRHQCKLYVYTYPFQLTRRTTAR